MNPILQLIGLASSITQSPLESNRGITFIAVVLVLFLMAVTWQLLHRGGPLGQPRRRRR